ncbi:hypothetical protein C8R11_1186 [Nitrosomonas aestuarii]|nr:hypothetical protein C8R11_1186 [Nitrosomonas aestuarii]
MNSACQSNLYATSGLYPLLTFDQKQPETFCLIFTILKFRSTLLNGHHTKGAQTDKPNRYWYSGWPKAPSRGFLHALSSTHNFHWIKTTQAADGESSTVLIFDHLRIHEKTI